MVLFSPFFRPPTDENWQTITEVLGSSRRPVTLAGYLTTLSPLISVHVHTEEQLQVA